MIIWTEQGGGGTGAHLQFGRLPLEHHVKAGKIGQVPLVAKGGDNHIPHLVKTAAPRTPAHLHMEQSQAKSQYSENFTLNIFLT